ncbi:MAG: Ig-like domain-containing protein [Thermoplasmata archaeon]|nr:MAG: Ig-like domain-containing protein [Thermoplasmata archaeon]
MCGQKVRRALRWFMGVLLIMSVIQVIPFNGPFVKNASAGSSWTQTTQADFQAGTGVNVTVTFEGNVTLALQIEYVEDNFFNESKISLKNKVNVDPFAGEAKLIKFNYTYDIGAVFEFHSVQQTKDGGYIATGRYYDGNTDVLLFKTNSTGDEEWNKSIGGSGYDIGNSVCLASDDGYMITGTTDSYGAAFDDVWLIKTDSSGNEVWNKTFGGGGLDRGHSIKQTSDGGYIITGFTRSFGPAGSNIWLIKTDSAGSEIWSKTFGGDGGDVGNSAQETSDGGFIVVGNTYSFGIDPEDIYLIKTDSSGNEEWNKTYGGPQEDYGLSVNQTYDGGYIISGLTMSFGPGNGDVWVIKTDSVGAVQWDTTWGYVGSEDYGNEVHRTADGGYVIITRGDEEGNTLIKLDSNGNLVWQRYYTYESGNSVKVTSDGGFIVAGQNSLIKTNDTGIVEFFYGDFTSTNLLEGQSVYSIDYFNCTTQTPPETGIKVQFSQNMTEWNDKNGVLGGWDLLTGGFNSIDLSNLRWQGDNFYYRVNLTSSNVSAPSVQNINVSYNRFLYIGTLESQPFNAGFGVNWTTISWNSFETLNTDIRFQLKTESSGPDFIGPDGTPSTYYEISDTDIWSGHDLDAIIQYKIYFNTSMGNQTPILQDVTIFFNQIPAAPNPVGPLNNIITNDSTPLFSWNFLDLDGIQGGLHVLIDDNNSFGDVDYDSGEQSSSNTYWQFPDGTGYTAIADGSWYWKVRTMDDGRDWSPYSNYWNITIDTIPPDSFTPIATPSSWTDTIQPEISFSTNDATSGVDYYQVKIDAGGFSTQTSPYMLPPQSDGIHNITVRAYDKAGNYRDGFVDVYIDATSPNSFTPIADPSDWTYNSQPTISFSTTDATSGIDHYEVSIDYGGFFSRTSPYTLSPQSDGIHTITVRAFDLAGNYKDSDVDVFIDTTDPVDFSPSAPIGWIIDNQPQITFFTTDATSGIDHYEIRIDSGSFTTQASPFTLPIQADGIHNIIVRAYDEAGNYIDRYVDVYIDTTPPSISHTPVTAGSEGSAITISATVTDDHSDVDYVELFYKRIIDTKYTNITMTRSGYVYSADIPADVVTTDGVDYYIKAADKSSVQSIAYYGAGGQVSEMPNDQNDIIITITDVDITPPTVIEKFPEGNNVPVSTIISVTFNEEMDTTITDNIFSITPALTGITNWEGNKLIFNSEYALEYGTPYTVTIGTVVKDLAGNNLEVEYTWQFITTSIQDVSPPTITDYSPRGIEVPIDTTITVTFNERMKESATKDAFSIEPSVGGQLSWDGNDLIFDPDSPLSYKTIYTITISTDAKDFVGNNLEKEHNWSFTTEKESEEAPEKEGEGSFWETWEPIITGGTVLASIIVFLIGFLSIRKKRSKLRRYMERIEDTFNEYKEDPKTCEEELILLRDDIKKDVHRGKIEENHFLILDKKIDDYIVKLAVMEKEEIGEVGKAGEVSEEEITEPVSGEEEVGGEVEDIVEERKEE